MHLAMATTNWTSAMPALPWAMSGMMPWKPDLAAEGRALAPLLNEAGVTAIGAAVAEEADTRLRELISGIYAYWHHPYRRRTRSRPVAWSEGSSRLDDYGRPAKGGDSRGTDAGLPALLVPSLVNRGYILDLMPERSFAGYLAKRGIRPLLLEWGAPGEAEAHFDLTAYIARLERALAHVAERSGRPVALVGYCMGGLLALAVALRRPDLVSGLGLLATPWDFHAEHLWIPPFLAASTPIFESTLQTLGHFPVDALQAGFAMLNPTLVPEKFRRFAALDPDSREARTFVAVEDWLNDGVPLAAGVARDCIMGWYRDNGPKLGQWRVAGQPVVPQALSRPSLVVIPAQDRIVPPASATALADVLPRTIRITPQRGHIGMVVSGATVTEVGRPLTDWLLSLESPPGQ